MSRARPDDSADPAARARSTEARLSGADAQAVDYGPPGGGNLLVAGIVALLIAALGVWTLSRGATIRDAGRALAGAFIFASAGAGAIWLGARRIRARRVWRVSRRR